MVSDNVYINLPNGRMPQLGIGTRRSEPRAVRAAIDAAIKVGEVMDNADSKAGVRHIDTAWVYGIETEVGDAIAAAIKAGIVKREELFITSKLWNHFHGPVRFRTAFEESLRHLQIDYIDLYLMHWPVAYEYQNFRERTPRHPDGTVAVDHELTNDHTSTWAAMESLVHAGQVRDIGVSNFCIPRLQKLLRTAKIRPCVNQVELHPYNAQWPLLEFCKSNDIHVTAFSPLGSYLGNMVAEKDIMDIAESYATDSASILIAWGLSRGTSVIPKTTNVHRVKTNFDARKVHLRQDTIEVLNSLNKDKRFYDPTEDWGVDIYCAKPETVKLVLGDEPAAHSTEHLNNCNESHNKPINDTERDTHHGIIEQLDIKLKAL